MYPGLSFQLCNRTKIDLFDRQTVQCAVQQDIHLKNRLLVKSVLDIEKPVLDDISFCNDRCKKLTVIDNGQLNELQLRPVVLRTGNHRCIVRICGQHFYHLLQQKLHLILPLKHQLLHLRNLAVLFLHHAVHI